MEQSEKCTCGRGHLAWAVYFSYGHRPTEYYRSEESATRRSDRYNEVNGPADLSSSVGVIELKF